MSDFMLIQSLAISINNIIYRTISNMAWYFNFCSPHLPNDPTINFHRYAQTCCLMGFMVLYMIIHIYYKIYGPDPNAEKSDKQQTNSEGASENNQKASDQNSQNNHEDEKDDKSVSIAGGYGADENSSYVTFDKKKKKKSTEKETKKKDESQTQQKVNINEIMSYFPIVFGHFAIGSAFSITYSPYAEQSIATILYIVLSLVLLWANAKRHTKTTRVIWGFECFLICFLVMSGLLEVGQANFNKMKQQCFSVDYKSLY